jgi:hypothetical protein
MQAKAVELKGEKAQSSTQLPKLMTTRASLGVEFIQDFKFEFKVVNYYGDLLFSLVPDFD